MIRVVHPGSRIPDPNCLHPGSWILIKEFKYFNPKKGKKLFLSSKKYDPGCSSRIPDPDPQHWIEPTLVFFARTEFENLI